ncbi:MAG: SH3 domain-containing protein [Chloroflexi bacterium]|nr:SH3 domain-containing protein [Chloroflexota bacterium]
MGAIILAAGLVLTACNNGAAKPTDVKISAPAPGTAIDVGQGTVIQGEANGDNITRVEVVVDGKAYASLSTPDKTKGVANFPVSVPWTPMSAGTHAIQLRAFGLDDKLLGQSEPLVMDAKASVAQVTPTPDSASAAPTAAQATATTAGGASATPTPKATTAAEGPKLTVTNDFVNVREGPNIGYRLLGTLDKGQSAPVRGKSQDGTWWQISYAAGSSGVGWVFGDYVQANSASASVPVASAPPLPTQPPQPTAAIIEFATLPPPTAGVASTPAPTAPLVGSLGQLKVDQNPVAAGGAVNAYWSVANIKGIWFDKGDGSGFQAAGGTQTVNVAGIGSQRTLQLRWQNNDGSYSIDSVVIYISGQAVATPVASTNCTPSDPNWRGGDPKYPFCVGKDMDWTDGGPSVRYPPSGQDQTIGILFNIYGVSGITLKIEQNSTWCPQGSTSGRSVDLNTDAYGNGSYSWNVRDFGTGGYIVHLWIKRNDGTFTYYNEKFMCIGVSAATPVPAASNTPVATAVPTATHPPLPTPTFTPAP